jgi:hypothetical protein
MHKYPYQRHSRVVCIVEAVLLDWHVEFENDVYNNTIRICSVQFLLFITYNIIIHSLSSINTMTTNIYISKESVYVCISIPASQPAQTEQSTQTKTPSSTNNILYIQHHSKRNHFRSYNRHQQSCDFYNNLQKDRIGHIMYRITLYFIFSFSFGFSFVFFGYSTSRKHTFVVIKIVSNLFQKSYCAIISGRFFLHITTD